MVLKSSYTQVLFVNGTSHDPQVVYYSLFSLAICNASPCNELLRYGCDRES